MTLLVRLKAEFKSGYQITTVNCSTSVYDTFFIIRSERRSMNNLTITTDIDESAQTSSFQNATLSSNIPGIAVSIAVYPKYPEALSSQQDVKSYLERHLAAICHDDWEVQVQIGRDVDAESACED